MAYQPLGLSGSYLEDAGQRVPKQNALLRSSGQFSGFDNMDFQKGGAGWFRNGNRWRDLLGRGTVKQQIDLGPMASDNAMLQYKDSGATSDVNPFKFY